MRADVGAETVAAEQHLAAEQRIPFPFKQQPLRQAHHFVFVVEKPLLEMLLLAPALAEAKVTADELMAGHKAGVGREYHVRQLRLRRDEADLAAERLQRVMQGAPLRTSDHRLRLVGAIHPGVDFILDAVMVGRAQQQLAHEILYLSYMGCVDCISYMGAMRCRPM